MKKGGNFTRRDHLLEIQRKAQKIWQSEKRFTRNVDSTKPKFMGTFPYPYMNGRLHLGHAFSMTKCEFTVRFKEMCGYNAFFPFGFHCTGMPISAAAKRLKDELNKHGIEKLKQWVNKDSLDDKPEKKTQYEILAMCEVIPEDIPKFVDPEFWCSYFPEKGIEDLKEFGTFTDFRRSMITTHLNPYYDRFIRWQFTRLKEGNFIKFGKRPSIFSIKDNQMCADHDRSEGEGVGPQEYTLIKLELINQEKRKEIECINEKDSVFMVAATLRPETMYGQTNCFVLPEGEYGVFRMKNKEVWICSDRSAMNMAYQELFEENGKVNKIGTVLGSILIGSKVKAPMTNYEYVYCLPMLSISMNKGTGVVTSVPSDAPDDYAVLRDFKKKDKLRLKFGLTDEMVLPFDPIEIIDVPGYSKLSAEKACIDFKIKSMNDKNKLVNAKDEVYKKGFNDGILMVGEYKGMLVKDAKPLVKQYMIDNNTAVNYYEPESKIVSRSGDECVVALCDQWYIAYGMDEQREKIKEFIQSKNFKSYNKNVLNLFLQTLDWLKEWGCSRNFGLGTRLPWDEQYLIESLSDSTIYMAYYTISHMLQGNLTGSTPGSLGISSESLRNEDFDYIFLGMEEGLKDTKISRENLDEMRNSFKYWYPYDLRVSAKDLIKNHLTMSLYNHEFIFNTFAEDKNTQNYLPGGYYCNGYINIDNKKMSKSEGNFYTMRELVDNYSADALRLALANGGDTMEDANFVMKDLDNAILKLTTLEQWILEHSELMDSMRTESCEETQFFDKVFESQMNELILEAYDDYNKILFRNVIKNVFYNFLSIKEEYLINCSNKGMRLDLFQQYIYNQISMLYPLTPHFSEYMFTKFLKPLLDSKKIKVEGEIPNNISEVSFPRRSKEDLDYNSLQKYSFIQKVATSIRSSYDKIKSKKKSKTVKNVNVIVSSDFLDWQKLVMNYFEDKEIEFNDKGKCIKPVWKKDVMSLFTGDLKPMIKKGMEYSSYVVGNYKIVGKKAFDTSMSVNEKELAETRKDFIMKDMEELELVIRSTDDLTPEETKKLGRCINSCVPGNPYIYFEFENNKNQNNKKKK